MSSSDLSELTSNVSSDDEEQVPLVKKGTIDHWVKNAPKDAQPPKLKKKRPPSPPHEYVLADRDEIAFIVMFRSRFSDLLPKSLSHLGPQDLENGVVGPVPSEQVERLLCGLLGLVLNRKKEVEKGHYTRALEDAISSHAAQWPRAWEGRNPLHGGNTFNTMSPEQKLVLMKTLVLWSLDSSEAVKAAIKESYKQSRHDDDLNQPLSVQAWGRDGDKRRFWLIEGQDDTHFRLYRESNPNLRNVTWRSLAGSIEELRDVADSLSEENTYASRRLRDRILAAIPRFEAGEDKRRRRDYRLARKAQFVRPEPGVSLYEGRTRGKRINYTYSDEEGAASDALSTRRSNRHSGISTPAEPAAPRFTASGRQVRSRHGGEYGESLTGQNDMVNVDDTNMMDLDDGDDEPVMRGRPRRATQPNGVGRGRPRKDVNAVGSSEDSDGASVDSISSKEWNGGDDDGDADQEDEDDDEDLEMSEDDADEEMDDPNRSLVVRLRIPKGGSKSPQPNGQQKDSNALQEPATTLSHLNANHTKHSDDEDMKDAPFISSAESSIDPFQQINGISQVQVQPTPPSNYTPIKPSPLSSHQDAPDTVPSPPRVDFNPHAFVYHGEKATSTSNHTQASHSATPGQALSVVVPHTMSPNTSEIPQ